MKDAYLHLGPLASTCNGLSPPFWSHVQSTLKYHLVHEGFSLCPTALYIVQFYHFSSYLSPPKKLQLESKDVLLFISPIAVLIRAPGTQ